MWSIRRSGGASMQFYLWVSLVNICIAMPTTLTARAPMKAPQKPDTLNPGYFVVKGAAWLMALAMALQALADLVARDEG